MSSCGFANFSHIRKNLDNLISSIENIELMEKAR
jgi:hypothetical protein